MVVFNSPYKSTQTSTHSWTVHYYFYSCISLSHTPHVMALTCQAFSHCRCCLYSTLHSSAEPSIPTLKILPDTHAAPCCHFQNPLSAVVVCEGEETLEPRVWADIFVIILLTCVNVQGVSIMAPQSRAQSSYLLGAGGMERLIHPTHREVG